jgi:hypothetical protein
MRRISTAPAKKVGPIGVIGDGRPKLFDEKIQGEVEERWKGWTPWQKPQNLIF